MCPNPLNMLISKNVSSFFFPHLYFRLAFIFCLLSSLPHTFPYTFVSRESEPNFLHRLLISSFLLFLSSLYFFVLGDSCRLPLARKIGCKSQVYSSYKLLLVRKLKKRGGNGAELVGGGLFALSYSTVLPHIE